MSPAAPPVIRLCLDLNIWVSDFLAQARGRRGGSSTWLVNAVRDGRCPAGRLQLVVSAGMLDRLSLVLARDYPVTEARARRLAEAIGRTAADGPAAEDPHVVLGGTGVLPIRDEEDRGGARDRRRWAGGPAGHREPQGFHVGRNARRGLAPLPAPRGAGRCSSATPTAWPGSCGPTATRARN